MFGEIFSTCWTYLLLLQYCTPKLLVDWPSEVKSGSGGEKDGRGGKWVRQGRGKGKDIEGVEGRRGSVG